MTAFVESVLAHGIHGVMLLATVTILVSSGTILAVLWAAEKLHRLMRRARR